MAYAAEWDLDDPVLDREEVEAVVQHVAALGHIAAEVTPFRRGLSCTFRFPVAAAADVVGALDPGGQLLGDDWYRDLDPPGDGDDGYVVRIELLGPVDGGRVDDGDAAPGAGDDVPSALDQWEAIWRAGEALRTDPDDDLVLDPGEDDPDDPDGDGDADDDGERRPCTARLRIEALDNREAWPVAFAIAAALVERLGGDLRDDGGASELDEELYQLQLHIPPVVGPAVAPAGGGPAVAPSGRSARGASVTRVPGYGADVDADDADDDGGDDDRLLN